MPSRTPDSGNTPVVNFRLGAEVVKKLDQLVDLFTVESSDRESRSSVIRKLINREYDRQKKRGKK